MAEVEVHQLLAMCATIRCDILILVGAGRVRSIKALVYQRIKLRKYGEIAITTVTIIVTMNVIETTMTLAMETPLLSR